MQADIYTLLRVYALIEHKKYKRISRIKNRKN